MHTVSVTRPIDAPLSDVWAALDDFGGVARYNPNVESSAIVEGPDTGEGATRECRFYDGGRIEERIVDYDPRSGYTVDFVDVGEFPLKSNRVDITVEALDDDRTAVTMQSTVRPKYGPGGWVTAKAVMKSRFRETFADVLAGLEAYLRTGEDVEGEGPPVDAPAG
jgi:uncharacterized protein YndB with AHSA1/START domain